MKSKFYLLIVALSILVISCGKFSNKELDVLEYYHTRKEMGKYYKTPPSEDKIISEIFTEYQMTKDDFNKLLVSKYSDFKTYRKENPSKYKEITRKYTIEEAFDKWDGSHLEATYLIKKNIKDPKSYEHISTKYLDNEDGTVTVMTQFRSKNSFGGYVITGLIAKCSMEGKVLDYTFITE